MVLPDLRRGVLFAPMSSRRLSLSVPGFLFGFLSVTSLVAQGEPPTAGSAPRLARTNLLIFHNEQGAVLPVETVRDWQKRRVEILQRLQQIMGPLPQKEKRCPLDLQIEEEADCGDHVRRLLSYASEPGSRVPAYLLIPKSALAGKAKAAGMLCLHQTHALGQKVVVGLGNSPDDEYGVELTKRGYVCLAPAYPLLANYRPDLKALGYQSGTMKAIWDNIRGLDLLESLPFVKRGSLGAIGHSLGGHNAIFTAVFDQRIRVIISSCGFDSFVDYMNGDIRGWTSDRYMPKLRDYRDRLNEIPFDFPELIGALAPRLVFVNAPRGDSNFKWRSVDAVVEAAAPVYKLYGAPHNLRVEHPECGHSFPSAVREVAYRLADDHLK
jgi:hypothetical protein